MYIQFKRVEYKNFLSVGNAPIVVDLAAHARTLIVGANGAAKSSLLDAVYFALYGRPFRAINKGALVNSVNLKDCQVTLAFSVGEHGYVVTRGIKPNVFNVIRDGVTLDNPSNVNNQQSEFEASVLGGMTPDVFRQMVVLGSANYVPFMQLPAAKRRETVESMLDISVFAAMNDVVKSRVRDTKTQLQIVRSKQHDAKKEVEFLTQSIAKLESDNAGRIKAAKDAVVAAMQQAAAARANRAAFQYSDDDNRTVESAIKRIDARIQDESASLAVHQAEARTLASKLAFLEEHDTCPTCNQTIEPGFKQHHVDEIKRAVADGEVAANTIKNELDISKAARAKLVALQTKYAADARELERLESAVAYADKIVDDKKAALLAAANDKSSVAGPVMERLASVKADLDACNKNEASMIYTHAKDEVLLAMLKDNGVKARIVDRYTPLINEKINGYLDKLNFYVQFTLDSQFNEKIKSRYRDAFEYNSFSEGEKLRIDISILLAWRDIMRTRSSMATNLLIMDEILDGSMDYAGVEDFIRIVTGIGDAANIFIISHRGAQLADKFESTLEFRKNGNFSEIAPVA